MELLDQDSKALIARVKEQEQFISAERKSELMALADRLIALGPKAKLMFICTHNSRRSQLAELWFRIHCLDRNLGYSSYSAGTEATAFNYRMVKALRDLGLPLITVKEGANSTYKLQGTDQLMFSKVYDDDFNPSEGYIAVMVCSDAEQNCPYIPGVERFALKYTDPKYADDSSQEEEVYQQKVLEIGREMSLLVGRLHDAV